MDYKEELDKVMNNYINSKKSSKLSSNMNGYVVGLTEMKGVILGFLKDKEISKKEIKE